MTPELWKRAKKILAVAQELDSGDLESFLDSACKEDEALRAEVTSLLECDALAVRILDDGPLPLRAPGREDPSGLPSESYEGRRIGPYRVERVLAKGGMGTVALAVREDDFSQRVALKLIKRGELSEELLKRFRVERQILANLKHPNIAAIYDAGTTEDGLPYFAMEYVEGERIDHYSEVRKLSIRGRLALFRQVCSAVQLAHRNLVVHRDLKPGNILVTSDGVPKLIDFGIAKPLSAELAAQSLATARGRSPMTVKYASPEQVRGEQVTTATDIYSLGVLLFELLTGENPYPPDSSSGVDLAWAICNVDPRRPSAAIRHPWARSADPSSRAFEPEASDVRRLRRRLGGDLDSIVLKALRKDPGHRYGSVEQFSEDIRRYLAGLPVIAREGTFIYRAERYLRRNWRQMSAVACLILLAVAGAILKIRTDRRLERAELVLAAERAGAAERKMEMLYGFLDAASPDAAKGEPLTAREVLDRGRERIISDLQGEPEQLAAQLEAMGMVYEKLGHYAEARSLLEDSLRLRRRVYNGDHPILAQGLNNLAALFYRTGDDRRAEILYSESLRMKRRLGQEGVDLTRPMSTLAAILMNRGRFVEAEEIYRQVLDSREQAYGREHADVATTLFSLGTLFYVRGDFERAENRLREALAIRLRAFGPEHTRVASARSTLGRVVHAQGRLEEAEGHFAAALELRLKLLGEDHLQVAFTRRDLAALRLDQGDAMTAEQDLKQALAVFRRERPEDSWIVADAESLLGGCLTAMARYEEAAPLLHRSYRLLREARSEHALYTLRAHRRLRELYAAWGRPLPAAEARSPAPDTGQRS